MRAATAAAAATVLVGLAVVVLLAYAGGLGTGGSLEERWVSDTARDRAVNHHAPAAGTADGGVVYAPISGESGTDGCALVALDGANGSRRWGYPIPPANCTIHSVADPTVADYDDDGVAEVFVATTERAVLGLDPRDGAVEFRHDLTAYGYTRPLVTDLTGDGRPEVVAVDVQGAVFVLRQNGTVAWSRQYETYTWGQPAVADFDGDGDRELVVGFGGSGELVLFERNGTVAWNRSSPGGSITWLATGQADADAATEVVVATSDGVVAVLDGRDGAVQWRRDLGTLAAVHAVGDGDGDGDPEVYAVAGDAVLRSYAGADGAVEWTTTLTTEQVQMTPPPSLGDVDGDGREELVAVTNNGIVSVVDPQSGDVVDSYRREVPIWVHPTVADVTGDGTPEVLVMYGDGRVVSLSYSG